MEHQWPVCMTMTHTQTNTQHMALSCFGSFMWAAAKYFHASASLSLEFTLTSPIWHRHSDSLSRRHLAAGKYNFTVSAVQKYHKFVVQNQSKSKNNTSMDCYCFIFAFFLFFSVFFFYTIGFHWFRWFVQLCSSVCVFTRFPAPSCVWLLTRVCHHF